MIQPIVLYGNPILRQRCEPYHPGTQVDSIIQDLWDTMYNAKGAGLAAPQIGQLFRIFIVDPPFVDFKRVFINPTILEYSKETSVLEEGCLSIPGLQAPIERPISIKIEWYDEKWKKNTEEFSGLKAKVIQHEYDHLEGVLWLDRASSKFTIPMITALKHCQMRKVNNVDYPYV